MSDSPLSEPGSAPVRNRQEWIFRNADSARLGALEQAPPFASIVKAIQENMAIRCSHADLKGDRSKKLPAHGPCDDFYRVVFTVSVSEDLFDWFFNSTTGYRASYYDSPEEGQRANRALLTAATDKLLEFATTKGLAGITDEAEAATVRLFVAESLSSHSAKAWLAEVGSGCRAPGCEGDWSSSDPSEVIIQNGRWELPQCQKAEWGRTAPRCAKIRLLGGFVNGSFDELIPNNKRRRSIEINEFGWS